MAEWQDGPHSQEDGSDVEADDFEDVLYRHFSDFSWDYTGILKDDGDTIPIPKISNCVTAIFEVDAVETAREMAEELGTSFIEPEHSRQYPDVTLRGGALVTSLSNLTLGLHD